MTNIRPFRGICYNLDKVVDLSLLTCPPYDVINEQEQDFYYRQSPYNFIRLILNKRNAEDGDSHNRYSRAVTLFGEWLKSGVLKQDSEDVLYFYKQDYFYNDKESSRLGFIALMQIKESGFVFAHENTHDEPKIDRLELLKNVRANLSPIFTIFSDKDRIIKDVFKKEFSLRQPDFSLRDVAGVRNSIWRLTDREKIQEISDKMRDSHIFIADGHHRYEVAAMYLKLMKGQDKDYCLDKSYNYIMTYFTDLGSDGLCIMPVHRLIKSSVDVALLKNDFNIKKANSIADLYDKLMSLSRKRCAFGFISKDENLLLELIDREQIGNDFIKKRCFQELDVAILDYYLLSQLLKIDKGDIMYTKDIAEAKDSLHKNAAKAVFVVRPTTVQQIKDVALCGEKMPPKSTYFYPKLLSGLVVHKFKD